MRTQQAHLLRALVGKPRRGKNLLGADGPCLSGMLNLAALPVVQAGRPSGADSPAPLGLSTQAGRAGEV